MNEPSRNWRPYDWSPQFWAFVGCIFIVSLVAALTGMMFERRAGKRLDESAVIASLADPRSFTGRCVRVVDADTIEVLDRDRTETVQLDWIDAPEPGQQFSQNAEIYLKAMVESEVVTVHWRRRDHYHRIVGEVRIDGQSRSVNELLLMHGWAWHYTEYDQDAGRKELAAHAKRNKRGLWAGDDPVPPWTWRSQQRKEPHR